ncbi:MAG: CPBP family intramembrane metalloprotease [Deltaproteobacteria bacterium]|nr:CPBP family intramembrane metalloprotease [Deltaproteobacteria bacterium]
MKRSLGLMLAVLLVEGFFIGLRGLGIGTSPVLLLAVARIFDLGILTLGGPGRFRQIPPWREIKKALGLTAILLLAGIIFLVAWRAILGTPFLRVGRGPFSLAPILATVFFINACLISPVVEEFLFRGILYRGMRERLGIWLSAGLVSLLFAMIHLRFSGQALVPFLGSIIFCLGYEKNKSIWTPILLHIGGNLLIFGSAFLPFV